MEELREELETFENAEFARELMRRSEIMKQFQNEVTDYLTKNKAPKDYKLLKNGTRIPIFSRNDRIEAMKIVSKQRKDNFINNLTLESAKQYFTEKNRKEKERADRLKAKKMELFGASIKTASSTQRINRDAYRQYRIDVNQAKLKINKALGGYIIPNYKLLRTPKE